MGEKIFYHALTSPKDKNNKIKGPNFSIQTRNQFFSDAILFVVLIEECFFKSTLIKDKLKFSVSVPPNQLIVYDISGREVTSVVGPLTEDSDLVLTCEVRGGKQTEFSSFDSEY